MNQKKKQVIDLTRELLFELDKDNVGAQVAVLRCQRIAGLIKDEDLYIKTVCELEMYPYTDDEEAINAIAFRINQEQVKSGLAEIELVEIKRRMKAFFPHYREVSLKEVGRPNFRKVYLNDSITTYEEMLNKTRKDNSILHYYVDGKPYMITAIELNRLVCGVKGWVYKEAAQIQIRFEFEEIPLSILEKTISVVDSELLKILPDTATQLAQCYACISNDNPEGWVNVTDTCRRIIKGFADVVFPPQAEEKYGMSLKDNNYLNRIRAFVKQKIPSDRQKQQIETVLECLGEIIARTDNRASRTVHSGQLEQWEAERVLIYTYLVLGDILILIK